MNQNKLLVDNILKAMKIIEKSPQGIYKIEKPSRELVEREYNQDQVERRIERLNASIANVDNLIEQRDEYQAILDLMTGYNG